MTDDLQRPDERAEEIDQPLDARRVDPAKDAEVDAETDVKTGGNVLAREGADAPDAADIEDPDRQL
jgi:hypothetical protein